MHQAENDKPKPETMQGLHLKLVTINPSQRETMHLKLVTINPSQRETDGNDKPKPEEAAPQAGIDKPKPEGNQASTINPSQRETMHLKLGTINPRGNEMMHLKRTVNPSQSEV